MAAGDEEGEDMHPRSKATRRGPMDEMRQLVRAKGQLQDQGLGLLSGRGTGLVFRVRARVRLGLG